MACGETISAPALTTPGRLGGRGRSFFVMKVEAVGVWFP